MLSPTRGAQGTCIKSGVQLRISGNMEDNLTTERPTFVSNLECGGTGTKMPPDRIYNLSEAGQPLLETRVSPRTDSVDAHFIVDRHPELDNLWIVGGGSGHGFKHGPMMGEHVAQRVTGKETSRELVENFKLKDDTF